MMTTTTPTTSSPEVLVLGLGAMGSATLLHLARAGVKVLGIDQFAPPHALGSTHGETRITRVATGEGAEYVPLVQRSHQLWREFEAQTGAKLFTACGGLFIAKKGAASPMHEQDDFLGATIANARRFNVAHELLDAAAIANRYPQFAMSGDETAYFEPGAGFVDPECCVETQLTLAKAAGASVRINCPVRAIHFEGDAPVVEIDDQIIRPGRLVVCAGAWLPSLLGGRLTTPLVVRRQVLHWFQPDDPAPYQAERFPIFIWYWGSEPGNAFYGFPNRGSGVKVATEQESTETTPDTVQRAVDPSESDGMFATHVQNRLRGLSTRNVVAKSCLYTNAPNARFRIGTLPGNEKVVVVSACSGHGFKHSAAIGEAVAGMLVTGETPDALRPFAW